MPMRAYSLESGAGCPYARRAASYGANCDTEAFAAAFIPRIDRMKRLRLVASLAMSLASVTSGQAAVGPVPQWIWIDAFPGRPQSAWFLRTFHAPAEIE